VTGLIALALLVVPFHSANGSKEMVALAIAGVLTAALVVGARHLTARNQVKLELTGGEQYRRMADEYRRLADLAITAQEHTDLKLGDVGVQLDYLREMTESMQKILEDVE
jgi:type II secretory pathway pseudopilin PulG